MERTVPTTESEEIELYQRTYYSLLRSTGEIKIRTLEEVHQGTSSSLHTGARNENPDLSAFIYCLLRLPEQMPDVSLVVLGQSEDVFSRAGYADITGWEEVFAVARRRRCYFNNEDTLACFIASRSDIDDVIPVLTAFQIEWNKIHYRLQRLPDSISIQDIQALHSEYLILAEILDVSVEDMDRLYAIWDRDFGYYLDQIASERRDIRVKLLGGSYSEYRRATHGWWENIVRVAPQIESQPVYFISSNTHSVANILSGYVKTQRDKLIRYLKLPGNAGLLHEWEDIQNDRAPSSPDNFFYYVMGKYQQTEDGKVLLEDQYEFEREIGIYRIPSIRSFDIEAQVIELSKLNYANLDSRLVSSTWSDWLPESDALILNIDYPLGMAAYNILSEVASQAGSTLGVYVMGKAATLNGVMGDVMISNVVHDEHSQNTFLFSNCFSASDILPDLVYGTVLDNQKAVTVIGTFLQNARYMDVFYREGYTDIEMEAGPYLSAVYEMHRPSRHPVNEILNLYQLPFDLGILHYASDTPLSKGKNLGAGSLSYLGMDSTYAVSLAILRRVFNREQARQQAIKLSPFHSIPEY